MTKLVSVDTDGMENSSTSQPVNTRIFVVEDSAYVRERLIDMLGGIPGVSIVGEAESPVAAIADIVRTQPDIVLLDVHLIDGSGMEVLRAIKPRFPTMDVIVLTNYAEPIYRNAYLKAGARYYLDKSHEFNSVPDIVVGLRHPITRVAQGPTPS